MNSWYSETMNTQQNKTMVNILKIQKLKRLTKWHANSVDPDQTAPEGAVWSGSTLFAIPLNI